MSQSVYEEWYYHKINSQYGKLDPVVGFVDSNLCDRIPAPPKDLNSPVGVRGRNSNSDFPSYAGFDESLKGVCYFSRTWFLGLGRDTAGPISV